MTPQYFVGLFLNLHPEFQPFQSQHDADEFTQKLLEDISNSDPGNAKAVRDTFEIEMVNTLRNTEIPDE